MRPGPVRRQVLEMYAVQAGLAIHHAQERDRLQERVRLAAATRTIVETASRELDLLRVVDQSFRPLREGFRSDWLLVRVFDLPEDSGRGAGAGGTGATFPPDLVEFLNPRLALPGSEQTQDPTGLLTVAAPVALACWDTGRSCVVSELGDTSEGLVDADARALTDKLLAVLDARTLVLVPLGDGPDCLGYLVFVRGEASQVWQPAEDEAALEVGREIGRAVARARLYQRERQLVAELKELDEFKGEMVATITHELKTPLTSIVGHVELLQDDGVAPVSVGAIARNVFRLQTLVEDMLLLTKIRDPHRPFVPVAVDLSSLVLEVCETVGIQAFRRRQSLDTARVTPGLFVPGQPDEIARMLTNVVGNAIRYTPDGGSISVTVHEEGEDVVVACSDDGIGIAEADLVTLFEEFDRSSNPAAHVMPGTGLGLAIVRRIVDRLQGSFSVESTLGAGSTFRIVLPRLLEA